ncbi:GNAT family N-acetyltransferase [Ectothiorhodospira variabilis]|uniref:GNAT family N-acetyltransferase n=1 Tax=Ectothiorhodospira variabilis TaxID=505694 RepID=UPI001EFAC4CA|nr:GNAT family N-acetyltransferase [Ectothiorhodospira variabilis]MCG5497531.1 GNAT family N-acetyltransferase [Ectothiorhodospira variabilis]
MDDSLGRVQVFGSLAALPEGCQALFDEAAPHHPFCTWPWFECMTNHALAPGDEPRFLVAWAPGGQPACVLPCLVEKSRPRRWRALQNFYAPFFRPVMAGGGLGEQGLRAIVSHLRETPGLCDALDLGPVCPDDPLMGQLEMALREAGFLVKPYFRFGNLYLPTQGVGWSRYLASRPGALRSTLRRKAQRLERLHEVRFRLYEHTKDLTEAVAGYKAVYASSWKKPEPFPGFMPGLIAMAAKAGMLRLGVLEVEGTPVAAQLWLTHYGRAYIYKLAHDPHFDSFSPGTLLTAYMMAVALDRDRVVEVDFLTGDDAYKWDWMTHRREQWGLLAMNRGTWVGRALMVREFAAGRMGWLRRQWSARFRGS